MFSVLAKFPIREKAITVGGTEGPRPGTIISFHFEVPEHHSFKFVYTSIYIHIYIYIHL